MSDTARIRIHEALDVVALLHAAGTRRPQTLDSIWGQCCAALHGTQ